MEAAHTTVMEYGLTDQAGKGTVFAIFQYYVPSGSPQICFKSRYNSYRGKTIQSILIKGPVRPENAILVL